MTQEEFQAKYMNTIVCGDCLDILKDFPDGCVDLVLTDPPYGVNLGNHIAAKENRTRWLAKQAYDIFDDTYENWLKVVPKTIKESLRITERTIVFVAGTMAWDLPRPDAVGGIYLPAACGRNCWGFASLSHCLFYGKAPDLNLGSKHIAISSTATADKNSHPCPKPIEWMEWLVDLGSRYDEIILDPFCGSGTTCLAAKKLGRRFVGIDISQAYVDIARKRLEAVDTGVPVQEARKGQGALFDAS